MKIQRVGGGSWACVGGGDDVFHSYGANQGFVSNGSSCLVVDSGFHYRTAGTVLRRVRGFKARRVMLVDTHYHSDHVFGNMVFEESGAAVLSHDKCRESMLAKSVRLLAKYRSSDRRLARMLAGVEVSYPSLTYRDAVTVYAEDDLGVEVFHPGRRAHTDGDSIVHVPEDGVVFAGDVLWVGYHPNLEDSDIRGQVQALKMILRLKPRRVVPGHGPVCGVAEVRRFIRYLEELDRRTRACLDEDVSGDVLLRRAVPPWAEGWKMRGLVEAYLRRVSDRSV